MSNSDSSRFIISMFEIYIKQCFQKFYQCLYHLPIFLLVFKGRNNQHIRIYHWRKRKSNEVVASLAITNHFATILQPFIKKKNRKSLLKAFVKESLSIMRDKQKSSKRYINSSLYLCHKVGFNCYAIWF